MKDDCAGDDDDPENVGLEDSASISLGPSNEQPDERARLSTRSSRAFRDSDAADNAACGQVASNRTLFSGPVATSLTTLSGPLPENTARRQANEVYIPDPKQVAERFQPAISPTPSTNIRSNGLSGLTPTEPAGHDQAPDYLTSLEEAQLVQHFVAHLGTWVRYHGR